MASLKTILIFFWGLSLRLISEEETVGLDIVFILVKRLITRLLIGVFLVFFDQWTMIFWILEIDFSNVERWL